MSQSPVGRPPNAFLLYRRDLLARKIISPEIESNGAAFSKIAGMTWRMLPCEEREHWHAKAKELKNQHQIIFPDYTFRPRKKSTRHAKKGLSVSRHKRCEIIAKSLGEGHSLDELTTILDNFDAIQRAAPIQIVFHPPIVSYGDNTPVNFDGSCENDSRTLSSNDQLVDGVMQHSGSHEGESKLAQEHNPLPGVVEDDDSRMLLKNRVVDVAKGWNHSQQGQDSSVQYGDLTSSTNQTKVDHVAADGLSYHGLSGTLVFHAIEGEETDSNPRLVNEQAEGYGTLVEYRDTPQVLNRTPCTDHPLSQAFGVVTEEAGELSREDLSFLDEYCEGLSDALWTPAASLHASWPGEITMNGAGSSHIAASPGYPGESPTIHQQLNLVGEFEAFSVGMVGRCLSNST